MQVLKFNNGYNLQSMVYTQCYVAKRTENYFLWHTKEDFQLKGSVIVATKNSMDIETKFIVAKNTDT